MYFDQGTKIQIGAWDEKQEQLFQNLKCITFRGIHTSAHFKMKALIINTLTGEQVLLNSEVITFT